VELQARIGLVAIDECHPVEEFRHEFTMLGLHQDVVWFGCPATLGDEARRLVLANAGFRPGRHLYQTEVIKTSMMLLFAPDR
jgi:hypothetical protein